MKHAVVVLTVIGFLMQGVAVVQAAGVSAEYRERAEHQLEAALGLEGKVTYETNQMSYHPAGEIVEDLGGGRKKVKLASMPGTLTEVLQESAETSAVVELKGKGELILKPGEATMTVDYGNNKTITRQFVLPKTGAGSVNAQIVKSMMMPLMHSAIPSPGIPVVLAGTHLEQVEMKEAGGKVTLTESNKGTPIRERVVDATTGQLLSDRILIEGGKSFEEKTFTGTTMVKGLPLPTAMQFKWFTDDGAPKRVVDLTDIKYDLK